MKLVLLFVACVCSIATIAAPIRGSTLAEQAYDCGLSLLIEASPADGYHFVSWSDGNTDNPREISVLSDIALEAVFALDDPGPSTEQEEVIDNGLITNNISLQKVLRNGQLFILRDGKTYTVQGQEVE